MHFNCAMICQPAELTGGNTIVIIRFITSLHGSAMQGFLKFSHSYRMHVNVRVKLYKIKMNLVSSYFKKFAD